MNKKILCITDKYHPECSANTVCADFFMNFLKGKGYEIDFLALKENFEGENFYEFGGSKVSKIESYVNRNIRKHHEKYGRDYKKFPFILRKASGLANRLRCLFQKATSEINYDKICYGDVLGAVKRFGHRYDFVVSFSMPFVLHDFARVIKKKGLAKHWIAIFLDPFVHNKCLRPDGVEDRKKIAEDILSDADRILMVYGIIEENLEQGYDPFYHKKTVEIALPNLVASEREVQSAKTSSEIAFTYAGQFYKDIRNPERMLDILSKMPKNFIFQILGAGCEDVLAEKQKLFEGNLKILGRKPHSECVTIVNSSDILINLGNTITNQTPSKVFEYISSGRPVLNFFFAERDTSLFFFKKYPLAFNINLNKFDEETIKQAVEFCRQNAGRTISFEEATKNLVEFRSENVVNKLFGEIEKIGG